MKKNRFNLLPRQLSKLHLTNEEKELLKIEDSYEFGKQLAFYLVKTIVRPALEKAITTKPINEQGGE